MEYRRYSFLNILAFAVPLFCLLVTWAASTTTTAVQPSHPPSSVQAAAEVLRARGYSLVASTLSVMTAGNANFSGTIMAPPDFAFSFAISKFISPSRRLPHRPSAAILLYHTLRQPLEWRNLSSLADGNQIPTLFNGNCLLFKTSNGDVSISASRKEFFAVRIRQPDMYADDRLVVHGIDGVLDPTSASKCSVSTYRPPQVARDPPRVDRKFLDHAVRALRRRGFAVVAAALSIRRSEMLRLDAVSLFAPSDRVLFSNQGGFGFDFRSHVLPQRHRFEDLARYPPKISSFPTLAANRQLAVDSVDGSVTVNGVRVNSTEVYQNWWIVVFSVSEPLDAALPCGGGIQFPAPIRPSVHAPAIDEFPSVDPPSPSSTVDVDGSQCRISDFPGEIEGGDLLCPVAAGRKLMEGGSSGREDVAQSGPPDNGSLPLASDVIPPNGHENGQHPVDGGEGERDQVRAAPLKYPGNIADDLFFYS
ncbi:hypothetical protein DM860_004426 [Cuscuta australis]|uniref:FAS1 domain-containing protein n=1 Tax=Cuscuta australis TaxID=267555 RepID=A0A328E7E5_9ASTE|nr:hypothetical protein DM860_004426 [Cuscuta australis]